MWSFVDIWVSDRTYRDAGSNGDGSTELRAQTDTELDGGLGVGGAAVVGAVDEVVLELGALAEAEVHVLLGAGQGRVLGDDALEALDLREMSVVARC